MKVIVAGYSKTGTKSMAIALKLLGYNVYDMLEHFWYHGEDWKKLLVHGGCIDDFKRMYKDVDAGLDVPVFCFWEQIHEAFPDAKIILTMRDEEKWYKSWHRQMNDVNTDAFFKLMKTISPSGRKFSQHIASFCPPAYGFAMPANHTWGDAPINEMVLRMKYRQHYEYVLKNAPKDKLLAYNVKEGWEPLCKFLGKDVPDKPFPHENVGGQVINLFLETNDVMKNIFKETIISGFVLLALGVLIAYLFYKIIY